MTRAVYQDYQDKYLKKSAAMVLMTITMVKQMKAVKKYVIMVRTMMVMS
jgi:hypothetical protein